MRRPMMVSTFPMAGLRTGASWRCGRSSAPPPARSPARASSSSNQPLPVECRWSPPATSRSSPGSRTAGAAPCALLKAIAYVERSWHQATYSAARGSNGSTLVSFDCGYGIMQITSGMRNRGDLPSDVQERIAIDYVYNIGWGTKMLIDKWNLAPTYAPVVGDRNPAVAA